MSFKLHLIIVSFIIVTVYLAWQLIGSKPPAPVPVAVQSPYSISIIHASWGLNCRTASGMAAASTYAKDASNPYEKLHEDNALVKLSEFCNGQLQCVVPLDPNLLGDPFPPCGEKTLSVEYRCFSFDHPWTASATSGALAISCDRDPKLLAPPPNQPPH